VIIAFRKM